MIYRLIAVALLAVYALGFGADAPGWPKIFPDYAGVTIPPNIGPLHFQIQEPGRQFRTVFRSKAGQPIVVEVPDSSVLIPQRPWKALLQANVGQELLIEISTDNGGGFSSFATITNRIAHDPIDSHLTYRLLRPLYNAYTQLGIYQRDLESFKQTPILENSRFDSGCLNCHTPLNRNPHSFAFNVRGLAKEQPMMLVISNQIARVEKTMGYLSWHPSGRLLAFSASKLSLFSHTLGETRDVYDAASNLGVYRVDSNAVVFPPTIGLTNRNETWPGWSADGRYLYYSSGEPFPLEKFRRIRYDIMRVRYDIDTDHWGEPELLVSSKETGLSACQPKPSPDGRWLLYTMCRNGNFPIYQSASDLHVMDLNTRQSRRLEINSDQADSWHSWSGNSRWVVFSSKRIDGLFARPHFSYVDANGFFHKPFVLAQEDPVFYLSFLKTFNVPEFMQGPVAVTQAELASAIMKPRKVLHPQGVTPSPGGSPAYSGPQMRE